MRYALRVRSRVVLIFATVLAAACATGAVPPPVTPARPVPAAAATEGAPRALSTGVSWVARAAEYHAIVRQVYGQALAAVTAASRARTAGRWAVILDADETVISNLTYQMERERAGLVYSAESWHAWVGRKAAAPLPGAKAFLDGVRALGGTIVIVTNRLASECDDTRAVFAAHALVYDGMLCRAEGTPSDKNPRFAAVAAGTWPGAAGPLDVVAWVGDNILDFPGLSQAVRAGGDAAFGDFGRRFFALPNPMYGSWQ